MTADCYPHLVIRCESSADGLWLPGQGTVPIATFKGISLHSKTYKMSTNYSHIAVSFFSNGVRNLFGIDASQTVNHLIDANHFIPSEIIEQVVSTASHQELADLLTKILLHNLAQRKHVPDQRIADFLLHRESGYEKKLQDYNVSERQFLRLFYRDVGINPVLYKRLYRLEETLATIRNNPPDSLTELAYNLGYADQSHFCREFKMFTGESPLSFIKKDRVLEDKGAVNRPEGANHLIGASM